MEGCAVAARCSDRSATPNVIAVSFAGMRPRNTESRMLKGLIKAQNPPGKSPCYFGRSQAQRRVPQRPGADMIGKERAPGLTSREGV
jgi:hypothetical protein